MLRSATAGLGGSLPVSWEVWAPSAYQRTVTVYVMSTAFSVKLWLMGVRWKCLSPGSFSVTRGRSNARELSMMLVLAGACTPIKAEDLYGILRKSCVPWHLIPLLSGGAA